jgi:hypothetical protein
VAGVLVVRDDAVLIVVEGGHEARGIIGVGAVGFEGSGEVLWRVRW